jgi:preprotein translocase subunit SecB
MNPADKNPSSFDLRKVYLKDVSFESPAAPSIFQAQSGNPKIDIELKLGNKKLEQESLYEVEMQITVTAKAEEEVIFLAEVRQAGIFAIVGLSDTDLPLALEIAAPNALLPFAREAISELVSKGGFPQFLLSPINFEALHRQKFADAPTAH